MSDLAEQRKMYQEVINKLEEENKSLKNELIEDMKTETKLNERIRFLEQCLDNKEKVNKNLREELQRYKDMWDAGEETVINIDKDGKVKKDGKVICERYTDC